MDSTIAKQTNKVAQKIDKVEKSTKGGKRPGSGRKAGVPNKRTAAIIEAVQSSGITPLEYLLQTLRNKDLPHDIRLDAAKSAAPYVHPKLAQVEHKGSGKDGALIVQLLPVDENL